MYRIIGRHLMILLPLFFLGACGQQSTSADQNGGLVSGGGLTPQGISNLQNGTAGTGQSNLDLSNFTPGQFAQVSPLPQGVNPSIAALLSQFQSALNNASPFPMAGLPNFPAMAAQSDPTINQTHVAPIYASVNPVTYDWGFSPLQNDPYLQAEGEVPTGATFFNLHSAQVHPSEVPLYRCVAKTDSDVFNHFLWANPNCGYVGIADGFMGYIDTQSQSDNQPLYLCLFAYKPQINGNTENSYVFIYTPDENLCGAAWASGQPLVGAMMAGYSAMTPNN